MASDNPPTADLVARIRRQIVVCDNVIERLTELGDGKVMTLLDDVRTLRTSLQAQLASLDGHLGDPL
jgi:hypothetical protein